jgi:hypothetical protein
MRCDPLLTIRIQMQDVSLEAMRTGNIEIPETSAASFTFSAGTYNSLIPLSLARSAIESVPRIRLSEPSSASSPAKEFSFGLKRQLFRCQKI